MCLTDLRGTVEAADEVWSDVVVLRVTGRAKVTQLEHQLCLIYLQHNSRHKSLILKIVCIATHQNVVRFDVSMEDVASFHEFEGQEQLLGIRPHSLYVQTNILTIPLQNFSQIHAERKRTKHRMSNTRDVHTYLQYSNLKAKVHRLTYVHVYMCKST